MNAEGLLAHYERIADAPDAIARLRRFILDLAVRGKLVPQDANDEPASELLKRIGSEKAQLVKAGEIKADKPLPPVDDDADFNVPPNWRWTRLGNVTSYIQRGKSPKYAASDGAPVVSQKCVQWTGLDLTVAKQVTLESLADYEPVRFLRDGDLLWNSTGTGTIGRVIRLIQSPEKLVCDSHVTVVRCLEADPEYIRTWLRSDHVYALIEDRAAGSTNQVELTAQMAINQVVPLPPLAEQHRIVAKVDELMALCDRLESAWGSREATRDRLAAACLARLNAPDPETFRDDARFALDALPALTTRPDQIKQLRRTILNLAVRGKLVLQDTNHKAVRLPPLRQFAAASGMDDEVFEQSRDSIVLPNGWQIAPLAQLSEHIVDCPHTTPKWTAHGEICIRTNQLRPRSLDLSEPRYVSPEAYLERIERLEPKADDILYSREGGILGIACRVPKGVRLCLGQRLMLIRAGTDTSADFLEIVLNSPFITDIAKARTTGGAAPRVNMSTVRAYPIPLPPLAEQRRIVAKVDELIALCDRLEAGLTIGNNTRRRLLDALLHKALEPEAHELATAE